jgi:hypothetical protein
MKNNNKIISVSGYGSTGSSAVVNFLEEFDTCHVMGGEFRLVQDPDGLEDLCYNLSNSWGWNRSDAYIRRFIKYTDIIGRKITPFRYGENLNKAFNFNFFDFRDKFIADIIDTKWTGHWFYHDYHERGYLDVLIENFKRSLSWHFGLSREWLRKNTKKSPMYFVRSDKDVYSSAREFLNNLFNELDVTCEHLVFDQLILPYHKEKFNSLFPNLKQIVVDRDPRDVYLDAKNYNAYPITRNIESFISFYESSRKINTVTNDNSTLLIKFEDIIYNYKPTAEKIVDFLEMDFINHTKQFTRLDPKISIKNTKTWLKKENIKYMDDMNILQDRLDKWCYDF